LRAQGHTPIVPIVRDVIERDVDRQRATSKCVTDN
jgi:hypothetical protein